MVSKNSLKIFEKQNSCQHSIVRDISSVVYVLRTIRSQGAKR